MVLIQLQIKSDVKEIGCNIINRKQKNYLRNLLLIDQSFFSFVCDNKLLQGFLNRIDLPHPYHFTSDQLMTVIWKNYFEVRFSKDEKGTGLPNNTIKKTLANQMMNTLWLRCKKKKSHPP